jgi:hypothetical protein
VRSGRGQQNRERGQGRRFFRAAIAAPTHRRASRRTLSDTGPREARRVASLAVRDSGARGGGAGGQLVVGFNISCPWVC